MYKHSLDSFFNRKNSEQYKSQLSQLLAECIKRKGAINFNVNLEGNLTVYVSDAKSKEKEVYIEGRVPFLMPHDANESLHGNVLLPFFLDLSFVTIPHNRIYYFGRNDYCLGEFFVRNLITNLILRSPMRIVTDTQKNFGGNLWKELMKVYYWHLIRYFFSTVNERPTKELMFANCIMPILNSYNPRFENDVQSVRHLFKNLSKKVCNDKIINELINVRNEVNEVCYK